jgi:hypothetical protein
VKNGVKAEDIIKEIEAGIDHKSNLLNKARP